MAWTEPVHAGNSISGPADPFSRLDRLNAIYTSDADDPPRALFFNVFRGGSVSPAKAFLPGQYQVCEWPSLPSQVVTTESWWAMGGKESRRQGRDGLCSEGLGLEGW